jgi:hypothetical protein
MNRILALSSVLLVMTSMSAQAQSTQKAASPTPQHGTTNQAADSASSGASSSGGPSLMQQRQKGMSPEGASGADANGKATGKMKQ